MCLRNTETSAVKNLRLPLRERGKGVRSFHRTGREDAAHQRAGRSPKPAKLGAAPRRRVPDPVHFLFFKRGEVEIVETGALGASESGRDSRHRDQFNRKPGSPDLGLITLETRSITGACHHFQKDADPDRGL